MLRLAEGGSGATSRHALEQPHAHLGSRPEPHGVGTLFLESLVDSIAAFGVISFDRDSMSYTGFILVPQFDHLQSVEPDDLFSTGFQG